jgi:hypothetical protein
MASSYDWGGYSTGGDEGSAGGRFSTTQGFGDNTVPLGTVTAVSSNTVTASWTTGSNAYLGEERPLINTSRGVYTTGTLASGSGTAPFTIVGSGTAWAATFGAGAKSDLFLEYTAFNGAARFVIPVLTIVDDTHLTAEYSVSEVGASSFNPSGAYKIFHGGKVSSLAAPTSGNINTFSINLAAGGSGFQVGDTIEQPLGYNYHGKGVTAVLQKALNSPATGGGFYATNIGSYPYAYALRTSGSFVDGAVFDSNVSRSGLQFNGSAALAYLSSFDTSAASQVFLRALNSGGQRQEDFSTTV